MNMKTRTEHTTGKDYCRLRLRLLLALLLALGPALAAGEDLLTLLEQHGRAKVDELDRRLRVPRHEHDVLRLDVLVEHVL